MKQKRQKTIWNLVRPLLVVGLLLVGGAALASQLGAEFTTKRTPAVPKVAVAITPAPTPTATPTPKPTVKPAPTATPKPARKRVAYVKPLPAVKPAPNSAVDHLVPVTAGALPTPTPSPGMGSSPASPTPTPAFPNTFYSSTNWSGYMSPAGNFTAVSGSWTVPTSTGVAGTYASDAAWIGIGGVTSGDLIQVGTDNTVTPGGQLEVMAWYELLPDVMTPIPSLTVHPGDVMSAEIHRISGDNWQINLTNTSNGQTFSINVTYSSSLSTAEWIQEDPSYASGGLVPFNHFTPVNFTGAMATSNGINQTAAALGAQAILLVDSHNHPLAVPTLINADGKSFSVYRP